MDELTPDELENVVKTSRARISYQRSIGRKPAKIDLALQHYVDLADRQAAIDSKEADYEH